MSMMFDTMEEVETFYLLFARATGFSVRKGYKLVYDNGRVYYRQWVCSREGRRDPKYINREDRRREPQPDTRVDCQATLKIRYAAEEDKYVVSDFCGGYQNIPFTMKDLYNRMNAGRMEEIADGDAEGAVAYLFVKKDADPEVYFNFIVTYDGRLGRLFWLDSHSREDYKYYGDVIVFDSTYKTNRYVHPLVVMCGINNHFCTSVFACSTVPDKEVETYEWILNNFLEAMDGKQPLSVVTDGAPQMRKAIKKCFPNAKHCLCSWHIQ
ncbi:protein FAR1-RELATED SEQUENCE 5-like [Coffea arabica]|uniref:Protein FAR1-RELATED SEQUENCE 5-like n=1 Tax=Coffea arabica TaxID=13443 RepID=A0ABM4WPA6_COFAR